MTSSSTPFVEIAITPDLGERNRISVFFRGLIAFPFLVLISLLTGNSLIAISENADGEWANDSGSMGTALYLGLVLVIVFSATYPAWLLGFMQGLQSFAVQIGSFALLLRDELPSVDARPYAAVAYPEIDGGARLNRFLPLVKWFLAIPHYLWIFVTGIGLFFVTLFAWFAILFTGRYPGGSVAFTTGWLAYYHRVIGYAFTLVTDKYPPFTLK